MRSLLEKEPKNAEEKTIIFIHRGSTFGLIQPTKATTFAPIADPRLNRPPHYSALGRPAPTSRRRWRGRVHCTRRLRRGDSASRAGRAPSALCEREDAAMRAAAPRCAGGLIPLREHIQRALYAERGGYFAAASAPVLAHKERVALSTLQGRDAYELRVAAAYRSAPHGWMTPVELFSPYLSNAIANRVAAAAPRDQSLALIEIGGGRGTLAVDVLQCLRSRYPSLYERTTYHLVEISPVLAAMQSSALATPAAAGKAVVHNIHALEWIRALGHEDDCPVGGQYCHVVATEVLDNLPHDFLRCESNEYWQAFVPDDSEEGRCDIEWSSEFDAQTLEACQDFDLLSTDERNTSSTTPFLSSFQNVFESVMDGGVSHIWCPTVAHQILKAISERIPFAALTLTDFTSFPGALPHRNGPVIQRVEKGVAKVYDSIQDAPFGLVDIMFPSNFQQLATAYHRTRARSSHESRTSILTQHEFFQQYASEEDRQGSTCEDGFNPVLSDFANVGFLLADPIY